MVEKATLADLADIDYEQSETNGLVGATYFLNFLSGGGRVAGYQWASEHGGPMALMMLAEYAAMMTSLAVAGTGYTADEVAMLVTEKVMGTLDLDREPPRLSVELVPEAH